MGNQMDKLVCKHESFVPVLDENLGIPYALPTGGVFVPMSPITGDLPIYSIPQIVLNAGMDGKDYQDCIYEINEASISRYSNVRNVIERLKRNLAPFDLYYECIESLIVDVEDICDALNKSILKEYNLIFIPFMHILRDETNKQHFGIIIDMLNRKQIGKKVNKLKKKEIKRLKKSSKQSKTQEKNDKKQTMQNVKNTKHNKSKDKTDNQNKPDQQDRDSGVVYSSLFGCFKLANKKNQRLKTNKTNTKVRKNINNSVDKGKSAESGETEDSDGQSMDSNVSVTGSQPLGLESGLILEAELDDASPPSLQLASPQMSTQETVTATNECNGDMNRICDDHEHEPTVEADFSSKMTPKTAPMLSITPVSVTTHTNNVTCAAGTTDGGDNIHDHGTHNIVENDLGFDAIDELQTNERARKNTLPYTQSNALS